MRFLLTRLVDWLAVPDGALVRPKDPLEYFRKLRFHQTVKVRVTTALTVYGRVSEQRVIIHTDGACSGNPGPGGWGAILSFGDSERDSKAAIRTPPTIAWN